MPTTAPTTTQTLNRPALVQMIALRTGIPASTVEAAIRGFEDELAHQVAAGKAVSLQGSFRVESVRRPRRQARNPRTGESVVVAAHNIAKFTIGARLKSAVAKKAAAPLSAERAAKAQATTTPRKSAPTRATDAAGSVTRASPAKRTTRAPRAKATPAPDVPTPTAVKAPAAASNTAKPTRTRRPATAAITRMTGEEDQTRNTA